MLEFAYEQLGPPLKTNMINDVLSAIVEEGDTCYIDDFLGNDDFDLFNRSLVSIIWIVWDTCIGYFYVN